MDELKESYGKDNLTKAEKKEIRKQERNAWEDKLDKELKVKTYKKVGLWTLAAIVAVLGIWELLPW